MKRIREKILDENIEILLKEFKTVDIKFNGDMFEYLKSKEFGELKIHNAIMNFVSLSSFANNEYCFRIILNFMGMLYERYISIEEFKSYILHVPKEMLEELNNFHKREEEADEIEDIENKVIDLKNYK